MANNATADSLLGFTATKLKDMNTVVDKNTQKVEQVVQDVGQYNTRISDNTSKIGTLEGKVKKNEQGIQDVQQSARSAVATASEAKATAESISGTAQSAVTTAKEATDKAQTAINTANDIAGSKVNKSWGSMNNGTLTDCTLDNCTVKNTLDFEECIWGGGLYGTTNHINIEVNNNKFRVGTTSFMNLGTYGFNAQAKDWHAVRVASDGSFYSVDIRKTIPANAKTMKMNDLVASQQLKEQGVSTMMLNGEEPPAPIVNSKDLLSLNVYQTTDEKTKQSDFGLSLEEVDKVFPCACEYGTDEEGKTVPVSWESEPILLGTLMLTQEHDIRIEELEVQNAELRTQLDDVTAKLKALTETVEALKPAKTTTKSTKK